MPDPWSQIIEQRYRGLEAGLDLARKNLINKTEQLEAAIEAATLNDANKNHNPISAISTHAPLFTTSSLPQMGISPNSSYNNVQNGYTPTNGERRQSIFSSGTNVVHGNCLDAGDRERIKLFMGGFIKQVLVPFVERQLASQNEILSSRKGIGKSFTSMRKWLSTATTNQSSGTTT